MKDLKRRRRDLNPRAAWTTYTLSRGASSATWVLLQMPKYFHILHYVNYNAWISYQTPFILSIDFLEKPLYFFSCEHIRQKFRLSSYILYISGTEITLSVPVSNYLLWLKSSTAVSYRLFPLLSMTTITGKSSTLSFLIASVPRSSYAIYENI